MKMTVERTQFAPTYVDGIAVSWEVSFEIVTDTGMNLYAPITIQRRDVPIPVTEASVTVKAFMEVMPGQLWQLYKDVNVLTELDKIAQELHIEETDMDALKVHRKKLEEEQAESLRIAQERVAAKRAERLAEAEAEAEPKKLALQAKLKEKLERAKT